MQAVAQGDDQRIDKAVSLDASRRHCQSKCTRLRFEAIGVERADAQTQETSQSVPLFQLVAGNYPAGRDDVSAFPTP